MLLKSYWVFSCESRLSKPPGISKFCVVGLSFNYVSTTFYSVNCTLWYVAGKAMRHVMSSIFRNGIVAASSSSLWQENKCMAYPTSKSQSHPTIYNTIPLFCHQSHFSVINPTICLSIPLFVQSHYYYSCHHPDRKEVVVALGGKKKKATDIETDDKDY